MDPIRSIEIVQCYIDRCMEASYWLGFRCKEKGGLRRPLRRHRRLSRSVGFTRCFVFQVFHSLPIYNPHSEPFFKKKQAPCRAKQMASRRPMTLQTSTSIHPFHPFYDPRQTRHQSTMLNRKPTVLALGGTCLVWKKKEEVERAGQIGTDPARDLTAKTRRKRRDP